MAKAAIAGRALSRLRRVEDPDFVKVVDDFISKLSQPHRCKAALSVRLSITAGVPNGSVLTTREDIHIRPLDLTPHPDDLLEFD